MKKYLIMLALMLPMSAYALSVGVVNDVTATGNGASLSFNQDDNEFTVGAAGLSFSTSDDVRLGIAYTTDFVLGLSGGTSVKYTTDSDFVLGVNTAYEYWGANLDTEILWNVNDTEFDATVGTGYTIFGLDGKVTSNWDIDKFSYEGLDLNAGYTWTVTENFSVRPNVTLPLDSSFGRGDISAGVSIVVSFDASVGG